MPDLVNLFNPPNPTPAFAQGTLVTFNPLTGANTVNVQGQVFTNLPLLNVPDVVNMAAGSVVMLAQLGGSYAILGRVVLPSSALLNTSAVDFEQASSGVIGGFGLTTTPAACVTATATVPAWANHMSFLVAGNLQVNNSTANADIMTAQIRYSGSFGSAQGGSVGPEFAAGFWASATATAATHQLAVTPGETVTFQLFGSTSLASWATNGNNAAFIDGLVVFQHA